MRRYALGEGYDRQPMPELDSEAIDFRVASESFAPLRKLTRGDLALAPDHTIPGPSNLPLDHRRALLARARDDAFVVRRLMAGLLHPSCPLPPDADDLGQLVPFGVMLRYEDMVLDAPPPTDPMWLDAVATRTLERAEQHLYEGEN